MTRTVAIYLFPGVEVLDFAGPYEVFTTASRVARRSVPDAAPFEVLTVARSTDPLVAGAGLRVVPDFTTADAPPADVLLVPGGHVDPEVDRTEVVDWVRQRSEAASLTASVCNGAFFLGAAGLLDGRPATTHWEDVVGLRTQFPDAEVREGVRWVDDGDLVTSGGIAAGIDMALHLVSRLADPTLAARTARQMEVPYLESSNTSGVAWAV